MTDFAAPGLEGGYIYISWPASDVFRSLTLTKYFPYFRFYRHNSLQIFIYYKSTLQRIRDFDQKKYGF